MAIKVYVLTRIDGEYAYVKEMDSGEELFIALALLPPDVDIGSLMKCEDMEFSLI